MDDTGCFVLGRPYGRRGVLSHFEGGGVPEVYSRKDLKSFAASLIERSQKKSEEKSFGDP